MHLRNLLNIMSGYDYIVIDFISMVSVQEITNKPENISLTRQTLLSEDNYNSFVSSLHYHIPISVKRSRIHSF